MNLKRSQLVAVLSLYLSLVACSDDDATNTQPGSNGGQSGQSGSAGVAATAGDSGSAGATAGTSGTSGSSGSAGTIAGASGAAGASGVSGTGASGGTSGSSGSSASGGSSGVGGVGGSGGLPPEPTADDIQYQAIAALPSGEQILFNDWNSSPNALWSITPDGQNATKIFEAYRLWSIGVSNDTHTIAFSCGDPLQAEHWNLNIGDAIQHTWLYDTSTQSISLLTFGNLNDECHIFSSDDQTLYLCRRYDFDSSGFGVGYVIAKVDIASRQSTILLDQIAEEMYLHPAPFADNTGMLYTRIDIAGASQSRSLQKYDFASSTSSAFMQKASGPVISPDGSKLLYADTANQSKLFIANIDGSNPIQVTSVRGTSAVFSPDGQYIAYLADDDTQPCSHIDRVNVDGSDKDNPTRLRDCTVSNEFITKIAWINH